MNTKLDLAGLAIPAQQRRKGSHLDEGMVGSPATRAIHTWDLTQEQDYGGEDRGGDTNDSGRGIVGAKKQAQSTIPPSSSHTENKPTISNSTY